MATPRDVEQQPSSLFRQATFPVGHGLSRGHACRAATVVKAPAVGFAGLRLAERMEAAATRLP